MKFLTGHLSDVGETYGQHFCHAMSFAISMLGGGIACLVHALFPFLFLTTGSRCIDALHEKMVSNRHHLTPADKKKNLATAI